MNLNLNHIGECQICGQGLLEIVRTKDKSKFLVMCDDCCTQWPTPHSAIYNPSSTMIKNEHKYSDLEDATRDEIILLGWKDYLVIKDLRPDE